MRFYVVSDTHGYYTELREALDKQGFFNDTEPHKLIVCGDMMDRGCEAEKMQAFMTDLFNKDQLIFIRGNHEDLLLEMLYNFETYRKEITYGYSHHISNGTFDTALQLSGMDRISALQNTPLFIERVRNSAFCKYLIPASLNYFETDNYIFVHGWIPYAKTGYYSFEYDPNWREASGRFWDDARWINGMEWSALNKIFEPDKKIVCGHFHASWGHCVLETKCSEFGSDADFTPFYDDHTIAIDACTAHSGFVNCIVIEDNDA